MRMSLCSGLILTLFAGSAAAGSFEDLGVPGGQLTSLSHNGRIAGIYAGGTAWRWAKDRGAVQLEGFTSSNGMSSWAQPIAGAYDDGSGGDPVAALAYTNSDLIGSPVVIGAFPGGGTGFGTVSEAYDVSDNGIAVGLAYDASNNAIAFRWSAADGMTRLAVNRPDTYSRANAISADGSTIVGWNDQSDGGRTGVIWRDGVPLDLVDANGQAVGEATAVSSDGRFVVGQGYSNPETGGSEAWRWTAGSGVEPIGCHDDGFQCGPAFAFGVSDEGDVVVGGSGLGFDRLATVWTPGSGLQLMSDYVAAQGVAVPAGWTLKSGGGVSADGKTLAGWGLGPDSLGSFVIDLHDAPTPEAILVAHGSVDSNTLSSGPFAGVAAGTPVTMTFRVMQDGAVELAPGQDTRYPIDLATFQLSAGSASDTLVATGIGPLIDITNDYPLSDGIHLFSTPLATEGQVLEFELFNPGGDMFDSDDLDRIDRSFDPSFFEKIAWSVSQGDEGMTVMLEDVSINDYTGTDAWTIGGSVSGLEGSGLVLQQGGGDDLAIAADGTFVFATPLAADTPYAVTVLSQPTVPAQTCTVANGSGIVGNANVTDVTVTCANDPVDVIFADGFDQT